jgi:O-succinylbenzoate synthase
MSSVYYHLYEMTSRGALNARSTRKIHPGALIRCNEGYGCLHPWPELGDAPLAEQLRCLAAGIPTPLTTQTLRCCAVDAASFRRIGYS